MVTQFLALEVPLQETAAEIQRSILAELRQQGDPLRWAITAVDVDRQMARVEAVVLVASDFRIPIHAVRTV